MLRFAVLGSGSSGNCSVVSWGETHVLIDVGLSAMQIRLRLKSLGLDVEHISAVVLTHEHSDHTRGLDVLLSKREKLPVFATSQTSRVVREYLSRKPKWHVFEAGHSFALAEFVVESFPVMHDAVDPVGFVFRVGGLGLGSLGDTGHATQFMRDRLRGCDALHIEANYDEVLLHNDLKRPFPTRQRISSRHGHLSNTQAADLIADVACERLRWVVLNHLSQDCNSPTLAAGEVTKALLKAGFCGVSVHCACHKKPLPFLELFPSPPVQESASPEPAGCA